MTSTLMRQLNEPVSLKANILINSTKYFHQAHLTRLVALTGLQGDRGGQLGSLPKGWRKGEARQQQQQGS